MITIKINEFTVGLTAPPKGKVEPVSNSHAPMMNTMLAAPGSVYAARPGLRSRPMKWVSSNRIMPGSGIIERRSVTPGALVSSGTAGLTFGAVTFSGAPTFSITNPSGGGATLLTVGAVANSTYLATISGSGNLVQTLLKHDLVDELWLLIHPLTLGTGNKLFNGGTIPAAFSLVESTATPSGVIAAHYRRDGEVKMGTMGG